jgi:polar amino acid transport system substrate-binding protein
MIVRLKTWVAVALLALAGCGADDSERQDSLQLIRERGHLIAGVFTDKPPFGYVDEQGNYVGYDTDLARHLAGRLLGDESKVEFVAVDPASRVPMLQSGKVDLILANMTVTPERAEVVDFTYPNLRVAVQALVRDDSDIQRFADLAGRTVIVTSGTTADLWLTQNHPEMNLLKYERTSLSLQALADGRGDAYVQDNIVLYGWTKQHPGYRVLEDRLGEVAPVAPAVRKGNLVLRDWLSGELQAMTREGVMLELYDRYLRSQLPDDMDPQRLLMDADAE